MHTTAESAYLNVERLKILRGGGNPLLAQFKPRELIEELRYRGYKGTLEYTHKITL